MNTYRYALSLIVLLTGLSVAHTPLQAQQDTSYWKRGVSIGLDFTHLLQVNPKVGAGSNRIGIGSATAGFANYRRGRTAWDNKASLLFGVQRFGSGPLLNGENRPFEKAVDELRFTSNYGYKMGTDSEFYYAADLQFVSQLTPTYSGNLLSDTTAAGNGVANARLFSPATVLFSLGVSYKPDGNWNLFFSPIGSKAIIVADDEIASIPALRNGQPTGRNIHGTEWRSPTDFENIDYQLGAQLRAQYTNKFLDDRLTFASGLLLYSNYLDNPQNIDVEWLTETGFVIFKGLQLTFNTNLFYDHDVLVQVTDFDTPGGVEGLGRRVSYTQQFLLKYAIVF